MTNPTDLNPARNKWHRDFWKFNRESILIILVSIAVISSAASWLRAERAIDESNSANATSETWQTMYKETERECRLAQLEIDDFKITLIRNGFDVEHEGESP